MLILLSLLLYLDHAICDRCVNSCDYIHSYYQQLKKWWPLEQLIISFSIAWGGPLSPIVLVLHWTGSSGAANVSKNHITINTFTGWIENGPKIT